MPRRSQVGSGTGSGQGQSPDSPGGRTVGPTNTIGIYMGLSRRGRVGGSSTLLSTAPGSTLGSPSPGKPSLPADPTLTPPLSVLSKRPPNTEFGDGSAFYPD